MKRLAAMTLAAALCFGAQGTLAQTNTTVPPRADATRPVENRDSFPWGLLGLLGLLGLYPLMRDRSTRTTTTDVR